MFNSLYAQRHNAAMVRIATLYRNLSDRCLCEAATFYAYQRKQHGAKQAWYSTVMFLSMFSY